MSPELTQNRITFDPSYLALLERGEKTSTVRAGLRHYTLGNGLYVFGRQTIPIFIVRLEAVRFDELGVIHAKTDGLTSVAELKEKIARHYPDLRKGDWVTYVRHLPVTRGRAA